MREGVTCVDWYLSGIGPVASGHTAVVSGRRTTGLHPELIMSVSDVRLGSPAEQRDCHVEDIAVSNSVADEADENAVLPEDELLIANMRFITPAQLLVLLLKVQQSPFKAGEQWEHYQNPSTAHAGGACSPRERVAQEDEYPQYLKWFGSTAVSKRQLQHHVALLIGCYRTDDGVQMDSLHSVRTLVIGQFVGPRLSSKWHNGPRLDRSSLLIPIRTHLSPRRW